MPARNRRLNLQLYPSDSLVRALCEPTVPAAIPICSNVEGALAAYALRYKFSFYLALFTRVKPKRQSAGHSATLLRGL